MIAAALAPHLPERDLRRFALRRIHGLSAIRVVKGTRRCDASRRGTKVAWTCAITLGNLEVSGRSPVRALFVDLAPKLFQPVSEVVPLVVVVC